MKKVIGIFLIVGLNVFADGIMPKQFKIEMPKNCQILMLNVTPERKAKQIHTFSSNGDCVENMGCIRAITQKDLDNTPQKERYYKAWQNPVWCRVSVGKKQGWVEQQFLKSEPCGEK